MNTLYIQYHLYRSNPAIIRYAAVPEDFSAAELPQLCCILFGLHLSDCFCEFSASDLQNLLPGMSGLIRLAKDPQSAALLSLDIHWRICEGESGENIMKPAIKGWLGFQIPAGIYNIAVINEMQNCLRSHDSYQAPTYEILYKDQQKFNLKKTENELRKVYDPEHVRAEIRMDLGMPLMAIFESYTLQELKNILDHQHLYGYSSSRKAECAGVLAKGFGDTTADEIFDQMSMQEYLHFRELALHGTTACQSDEALARDFPVLWSWFRIRFIKKTGLRISSDILQDYETWFDGQEEKTFCLNKKIRQAMRWCGFYYGIFSIDHCFQVLETIYPGEITMDDLTLYWLNPPSLAYTEKIGFTGSGFSGHTAQDYAYDQRVISEKEKALYLEAVRGDASLRKLPADPESFEAQATKSLNYADEDFPLSKIHACFPYSHSVEIQMIQDKINEGISMLRVGLPADTIIDKIFAHYYLGYGNRDGKTEILNYLKSEADKLPQFLYYGFSKKEIDRQHIESRISKNINAINEAKAAQQKAARAAAARQRAEARKAQGKTTKKTSGRRTTR